MSTTNFQTMTILHATCHVWSCYYHHCIIILNMSKKDFNLAIIVGTNRDNRQSIHVAHLIEQVADKFPGFKPQLIDLLQFNFSLNDTEPTQSDPNYDKLIEAADAFLIVLPEYNHAFPAALKRALDSEYAAYFHKPVALAGVSSGPWGGTRAIEAILPVLRALGMLISRVDLNFPQVQDLFNQEGILQDQAYLPRVEKTLQELLWLTQSLRWGRDNLS